MDAETSRLPAALVDVMLVDGKTAAATGGASISAWLDGVRRTAEGELRPGEVPYPQPAIRQPRFTRWALLDVRRYWQIRATTGTDTQTTERVKAQARKASAAARAKRASEFAQ